MSKFFKYNNITFKANTGLFVGTLEEFSKKFNLSKEDIEFFTGADGTVIKVIKETKKYTDNRRVIWLRRFKNNNAYDLGVFVHELAHLVFMIADSKGVEVKPESNNETFCYLIDELFEYYYKQLTKK